jgi:hypothetical protein
MRAATMRGAVHTLMRQGEHRRARRLLLAAAREDPLALRTWMLGVLTVARGGA